MATERVRGALADRKEVQNDVGIHSPDALEYMEFGMVDGEA